MAEVSDLHLSVEDDEEGVEDIEDLDSVPYWSNDLDHDDIYVSDSDPFSPRLSEFVPSDPSVHAQVFFDGDDIDEREACGHIGDGDSSDSDSVADVSYFNHEDRVSFVMDLFERRAEQSHIVGNNDRVDNPFSETLNDSNFRVFEGNDEIGSNFLDLGLGLGLALDRHAGEDDDSGGFMIRERGDDFFVGRRPSVSESGDDSNYRSLDPYEESSPRLVNIESDSGDEEVGVLGIDLQSGDDDDDGLDRAPDDLGLPLCWDCLHLEDQRDANEDFEWEEVIDAREVLSMVIDADEERSVSTEIHEVRSEEEAGEDREETMRNLEWEVLLTANNLERNQELEHEESYLADPDAYIYPAEYEMIFGQFAETEASLKGSPPAAKTVVENLPSIFLTQDDVQNNNVLCAVCKDEISTSEQAKRLPCSHHYHGDCIIPWLSIRNTCPVCRYELPTDDPDYERRRTQRAGHRLSGDSQARNDFEIFPQH
ncbi:PREDICTED: uncharacterized protein LOC104600329 [Nelumbo nucifera]|uniref:RING-type E3 ubiquitin transferase n=1 Tax=Nelumbo nucifera TaxID=4432 RepID=A0A1U8A8S6_NELNU|nr:PREDICTED: uncharacterized protein LOC104600329 [Nelumbo nucifera]